MRGVLKRGARLTDLVCVDRWEGIVEAVNAQLEEAQLSRQAVFRALAVIRATDLDRQRQLIAADLAELMDADVVRIYDVDDDGQFRLLPGQQASAVPPTAWEMERELVAGAPAAFKSLISSHPALDSRLASLAEQCAARGLVVHALLAGVSGDTQAHGMFVAHWINHERPAGARRKAFYYYWDMARYATVATSERARIERRLAELHQHAYIDKLTGLPSGLALDEQLRNHHDTQRLSVLVLDFDGMREANNAFGYEDGGDVLIGAVGRAIGQLAREPEFPARLHRGGDEFAIILPGADFDSRRTRQ